MMKAVFKCAGLCIFFAQSATAAAAVTTTDNSFGAYLYDAPNKLLSAGFVAPPANAQYAPKAENQMLMSGGPMVLSPPDTQQQQLAMQSPLSDASTRSNEIEKILSLDIASNPSLYTIIWDRLIANGVPAQLKKPSLNIHEFIKLTELAGLQQRQAASSSSQLQHHQAAAPSQVIMDVPDPRFMPTQPPAAVKQESLPLNDPLDPSNVVAASTMDTLLKIFAYPYWVITRNRERGSAPPFVHLASAAALEQKAPVQSTSADAAGGLRVANGVLLPEFLTGASNKVVEAFKKMQLEMPANPNSGNVPANWQEFLSSIPPHMQNQTNPIYVPTNEEAQVVHNLLLNVIRQTQRNSQQSKRNSDAAEDLDLNVTKASAGGGSFAPQSVNSKTQRGRILWPAYGLRALRRAPQQRKR